MVWFLPIISIPIIPLLVLFTTIPYRLRYGFLVTKLYFKGFFGQTSDFVLDPESVPTQIGPNQIENSDNYQSIGYESRDEVALTVPETED